MIIGSEDITKIPDLIFVRKFTPEKISGEKKIANNFRSILDILIEIRSRLYSHIG